MSPLFVGPNRHMWFRQNVVHPPHGIPATPIANVDDISVHGEKDKTGYAGEV